jgi:tetratricopeptide (TPR) repeat protein
MVDPQDTGSPRGSADLRYQEGIKLDAEGDAAGAVAALEAATRLDPGHALAWDHLGLVHLQLADANAAIVAFGSSLKARRENPEAYIGMGFALARQGDEESSESCFKNAFMQTLFDTTPWVETGKYLFLHGNTVEANFCFQSALQIDPDDPDALAGIRGLLSGTGANFVARDEMGDLEPVDTGEADDDEDDEDDDDDDGHVDEDADDDVLEGDIDAGDTDDDAEDDDDADGDDEGGADDDGGDEDDD